MKSVIRLMALIVMVFFIGCATGGGGKSSGGSAGGGWTDADLERMGVKETYNNR